MKKALFEVCCGCLEDAVMAEKGGADRIELNSALFLGGLTPSIGTVREVKKQVNIPAMCMVRPREGGFCYTEYEYATMLQDAREIVKAGADGIVFGFLHEDGTVDRERTEDFIKAIKQENPNIVTVFHRAIDVVPDVFEALDTLIELGVDRVLTSGQRETAVKGAELIRKMLEHADGRIDILPGGSLNEKNVGDFICETGVTSVHASARAIHKDTSVCGNPEIFFGGLIDGKGVPEDEYKVTDPERVQAVCRALEK